MRSTWQEENCRSVKQLTARQVQAVGAISQPRHNKKEEEIRNGKINNNNSGPLFMQLTHRKSQEKFFSFPPTVWRFVLHLTVLGGRGGGGLRVGVNGKTLDSIREERRRAGDTDKDTKIQRHRDRKIQLRHSTVKFKLQIG